MGDRRPDPAVLPVAARLFAGRIARGAVLTFGRGAPLFIDQRAMFILAAKPYLEGKAAERMQEGRVKGGKTAGRGRAKRAADSSSPKSGESYSATDKHAGKTTTALAAQAGVSRYKVEQASAVQKADPEAAKDVLAGKSTLKEAVSGEQTKLKSRVSGLAGAIVRYQPSLTDSFWGFPGACFAGQRA
jgi:hypothetical protein